MISSVMEGMAKSLDDIRTEQKAFISGFHVGWYGTYRKNRY